MNTDLIGKKVQNKTTRQIGTVHGAGVCSTPSAVVLLVVIDSDAPSADQDMAAWYAHQCRLIV